MHLLAPQPPLLKLTDIKNGWSSASGASPGRLERFNHDNPGQLLADGQARVAHLAYEIALAGEQPDNLVLAKPQFAQSILQFRAGAKLADAHRHARLNPAQGTKFTTGFRLLVRFDAQCPAQMTGTTVGFATDSHYTLFGI